MCCTPLAHPGAARAKSHAEAGPRTKRPAAAARGDSGDSEDEGEATPRVSKKARSEGFEVVPLAKDKKGSSSKKGRGSDSDGSDSDTDSEDEFDMLDDQGKAEVSVVVMCVGFRCSCVGALVNS